jgi:hypothetical protein
MFNAFSGQRFTPSISGTINPTSFGFASSTTPGAGINGSGGDTRFAKVARNFYKQPNIWYLDMRVSRRFHIKEDMSFELLAEAFNLFNRTQVTGVNRTFYSISGSTLTYNSGASGFNSVTGADSTLFRERQVQLGARFEF